MAKISARGAKELSRRKTPHGTYVLTSDGRILWKSTVPGDHFTIIGRIRKGAADYIHIFGTYIEKKTA